MLNHIAILLGGSSWRLSLIRGPGNPGNPRSQISDYPRCLFLRLALLIRWIITAELVLKPRFSLSALNFLRGSPVRSTLRSRESFSFAIFIPFLSAFSPYKGSFRTFLTSHIYERLYMAIMKEKHRCGIVEQDNRSARLLSSHRIGRPSRFLSFEER